MKKRYNFTLDEDLMDWFKGYAKKNRTKCSAILNQHLHRLFTENNKNVPYFGLVFGGVLVDVNLK